MRDYIFNNMIPFDTLLLSIYYGPSMDSTCIGQTFPSIEVISKKFKMIYSFKLMDSFLNETQWHIAQVEIANLIFSS